MQSRPSRTFAKPSNKNMCCGACYMTKTEKCLCYTLVWLPLLTLVILLSAILINAALIQDRYVRTVLDPHPVFMKVGKDEAKQQAVRLGKALQIKTVSYNFTHQEVEALEELNRYIEETYPGIHSAPYITRTRISKYSLLYRVEGTVETQNPYLLCAHMDVVSTGKYEDWTYDPFLGEIVEDAGEEYVYGRGAMDVKQALFGILEALEHLVQANQQPKRTFYMAFGHDEEIGGFKGAIVMKEKLHQMLTRNEEDLDFLLDEGLFVSQDIFPGTQDPIIQIGVSEKGYATFDLEATGGQYHSSIPPKETAITILAKAITNLKENPQPSRFGQSVEYDIFAYFAPHTSFVNKLLVGNLWLFSSFFSSMAADNQLLDAHQRTTTAVPFFTAGIRENIVPPLAKAVINHRIHPADDLETVLQNDVEAIGDDRVKVSVRRYNGPPPVSPYANDVTAFQVVAGSALDVYPDGHIVPGIMLATTDSRHYRNLTSKIYRFSPTVIRPGDVNRFHGIDERISVEGYSKAIEFYHRVMKTADFDVVVKEGSVDGSGSGSGSGSGVMEETDSATLEENEQLLQEEQEAIGGQEDEDFLYEGSLES